MSKYKLVDTIDETQTGTHRLCVQVCLNQITQQQEQD